MENKKQKSTGKTVAIIILVVLLVCSLGYIAYDKVLSKSLNKDKTEIDEKSNKVEKLDVNSRLVKNLYHNVSTGEMSEEESSCVFNFMYPSSDNPDDVNFYVDKANEEQKMKILSRLLSEEEQKMYFDEKSLIPERIPEIDGFISFSSSISNENQSLKGNERYYTKDYIERLYKKLYGENATLDTSVPIYGVCSLYKYISSVNKYILYVNEYGCGGTCGNSASYATLTKAEKNGKELKIYEKVTEIVTSDFDTEESGKKVSYKNGDILGYANFVYTFKLEDDGMYSFYSRVKES